MKVVKRKTLGYADIVVYDNGIFNIHVLSSVPISLEQAVEINEIRLTLMEDDKALVLSTSEDEFVVPTPEAIKYILSANRMNNVKANAFVFSSFSQRLAAKAAGRLDKMPAPISFFKSREEAIEWLLNQ